MHSAAKWPSRGRKSGVCRLRADRELVKRPRADALGSPVDQSRNGFKICFAYLACC
jgi:hypothetical protein